MFGKIAGAIGGALKQNKVVARLNGKDELQAIVAAGVLVSYAPGPNGEPGTVTAQERGQIIDSLWNNEAISKGFSQTEVSSLVSEYVDAVAAGAFSGKRRLRKEIEDVAGNPEVAERVFLVALDVAATGEDGINAQEKVVLGEIATILRQNLSDYI